MATGKDKQLIYQELKQYISLLRDKHISVLQAYLFGSYATGRADEWSDIDLASLQTGLLVMALISDLC